MSLLVDNPIICQAFFSGDPDAWEKLQRALKAQIDLEKRLRKCAAPCRSPSSPASTNGLR